MSTRGEHQSKPGALGVQKITMPVLQDPPEQVMQETHQVSGQLTCQPTLTFCFELPWPASDLSPNARQHWSALARAKKAYRARCRAIGEAAGVGVLAGRESAVAVHLAFFPPDRRGRDLDNLLASMKSGLDGLADAMGVDDRRWRISLEKSDTPVKGGLVAVSLEAA